MADGNEMATGAVGCPFCGGTPRTRTHVFRKAWLAAVLPNPEPFMHRHHRSGEGGFERTWSADEFDLAPRVACQPCNGGWMHDIERRAEAIIEPMVVGLERTIAFAEHEPLARWVLTCAAVLDHTQAVPVVDEPLCRALKDGDLPHSFVWLASTDAPLDELNAWTRSWTVAPRNDRPAFFFCTFRIKHFVAQALLPLVGTPTVAVDRSGGTGSKVKQIWPSPITPVLWPPPERVPAAELETFSRAFEQDS